MKTTRNFFGRHSVGFIFAIATCAHAAVTNVAWYRLGENDPGGISGLAVTNTTTDIIGANHLKQYGSPLYTNAVSANAVSHLASSLAVQFNGTSQWFSNAVVSTATNNFGIEAWVKPNTTSGAHYIAYNGIMASGGWGIYQSGTDYAFWLGLVGGGTAPGSVSSGVWTHVALVRNNGTNTLYVNGVAATTTTSTPFTPTNAFGIGVSPQDPGVSLFNGTIDEVRVFTFAPGQFSTNDLLVNFQRVATQPATGVTATNAMLNGNVNPLGSPTSVWFDWGTTTNYGNVTPAQAFNTATNFSYVLTNLFGGVYHFRAVASNSLGFAVGTNQSFAVPLFILVATNLSGTFHSSAAWGDYDNDGRLDFYLTGETNLSVITNIYAPHGYISEIWRNTGTGFTNINSTNLYYPSPIIGIGWGDYDNDGFLDLLAGLGYEYVFRNLGGAFSNPIVLTNASAGWGGWGDFDNDGRLDILAPVVLRNTGNGFVDIGAAVGGGNAATWGDVDNDGLLDALGTGSQSSRVLRNTGNGFTNAFSLPGVGDYGNSAWADYDNDGRLDVVLIGANQNFVPLSQIWRNTGNSFSNINAGLQGVDDGSVEWGDFDNDGLLDILLTGATNYMRFVSQIWRNTGSGFTNIDAGLPGVSFHGAAKWGDYDNDGRLDILLTGTDTNNHLIAQIWRNNTPLANNSPAAPAGLTVSIANSNTVVFSWNAAADAQTPPGGLTYNLRVGTTPGGSDVVGPMAAANGLRRLPQRGNAGGRLFAFLRYAQGTPYYWSVQAIDTSFAGSPFASEQTFKVLQAPPIFVPVTATNIVAGDSNGNGVLDENEFASLISTLNGNGIVSQSELDLVLSNYFPYSPWLFMTNVAGLGGTNVTFTLSNSTAGAFSVEYTTNFSNWYLLGPATPRYLFTDTNAPAVPQRYYRLRWP